MLLLLLAPLLLLFELLIIIFSLTLVISMRLALPPLYAAATCRLITLLRHATLPRAAAIAISYAAALLSRRYAALPLLPLRHTIDAASH